MLACEIKLMFQFEDFSSTFRFVLHLRNSEEKAALIVQNVSFNQELRSAVSLRTVGVQGTIIPSNPSVDMAMVPCTLVAMVPCDTVGDISVPTVVSSALVSVVSVRFVGAEARAAPRVVVHVLKLALAAASQLACMCLANLDDVLDFGNQIVVFVG